jgi:hypothetical protein
MTTILLFKPHDTYGWLISILTWSKFCHGGVTCLDPKGTTVYYEMLGSGMQRWLRWYTPGAQVRLTGIPDAWAHQWLETMLATSPKYGIADVIGCGQDITGLGGHGDREGIHCIELLVKFVQAAMAAGFHTGLGDAIDRDLRALEAHKVSPKALARVLRIP